MSNIIDVNRCLLIEGLIASRVNALTVARTLKEISISDPLCKNPDFYYKLADSVLSNSKAMVGFACAAGRVTYNLNADEILKAAEKEANAEAE